MVRENQKQQVQGKVGLGQLYAALGMVLRVLAWVHWDGSVTEG